MLAARQAAAREGATVRPAAGVNLILLTERLELALVALLMLGLGFDQDSCRSHLAASRKREANRHPRQLSPSTPAPREGQLPSLNPALYRSGVGSFGEW